VPTYQYTCTECGNDLEVVQSFTDEALTECPQCSGRLRKVFSPVGVVFKGSGFYRTDSRAATSGAGASASRSGAATKGTGTTGESVGSTGESVGSTGGGTSTPTAAAATDGSSGSSAAA
jgi:putative FmdB family regulatory protein